MFPPTPLLHPVKPGDKLQHHGDEGKDDENSDVNPFPIVFTQEIEAFENIDDG